MSDVLADAPPLIPFSAAVPWDEMVDGTGGLRPRWSTLFATLSGLGREALSKRVAQLDRIFTEDGVTGLLPGAVPVAWRCDPVPLALGAAEFAALEAGLAQRAQLLEAVLADIYGAQELLAAGLLPPALVFANPAFLRPCRTMEGDGPGRRLYLYAAELLRGPDGVWRVVADRTADAAGIAYAQENRRALARVMPEIFKSRPPRPLTPFFEAWQDALQRLAPDGGENPGLALLTPGPGDKLWFEHVMLARELSCTLVEGADLTVRDGTLFLKTLRGLQRVDVLLRRQDGRTLDALELEPRPRQGVTGLLDAVRAGTVRIVNDPGAGCAEAPALAAFLPGLARHLLGEDLLLAGVPTIWMGDPAACERILPKLVDWRIRPALDGTVAAVSMAGLPAEAREAFAARIAASPGDFVATAPVLPSVAPCVVGDGFSPLPIVLRMFMMFDGESWRALPGGLARTLSEEDLRSGRLPLHTLTKDVWVAADEGEELRGPASLSVPPLAVRRTSGDLPSRVADNFYWLGRNLERLEAAARLLRIALYRLERPGPTPRENAELRSLVDCLVDAGLLEFEAAHSLTFTAPGDLLLQIAQPEGELSYLLTEVSRLTELLRDRLTQEVYSTITHGLRGLIEQLARLQRAEHNRRLDQDTLFHATSSILTFSATVAGLAAENMVRGGGRLFLDLGRRVERGWATAGRIARVLDQKGAAAQPGRLEPGLRLALELCDSVITYRSRYLTMLQPAPVLDLILADEGNPRALAFQFVAIRDVLSELAGTAAAPLPEAAAALIEDVQAITCEVAMLPEQQAVSALPSRLEAVEAAVAGLSDRISRQYFALLPEAHGLGVDEQAPWLGGTA